MIELINVSKTYRTNKNVTTKALKNINLIFPDNGMIFIVGRSGSGKSTLLNLIGGLDGYDEGDIVINGKSTKDFGECEFDIYRNTSVGFVFQEYNLIETFTVGDNIRVAGELQNKTLKSGDIDDLLAKLDLRGYAARMPGELSSGQKQRVAIARALVKEPEVILADEPTGALDSETGEQIIKILKQLAKDILVIVVSHDLELARKYADRIITIKDGSIISDTLQSPNKVTRKYDKGFRTVPIRFPLKSTIRIALGDYLKRPVRLALIAFFLSISFILFGLVHTIAGYGAASNAAASMKKAGINYVSWDQWDSIEESPGIWSTKPHRFNDQDIAKLSDDHPDYVFFPIFPMDCRLYSHFADNENTFFSPEITGGIELNEELISFFGLTLTAGRYPLTTEGENEIAISRAVYELFNIYGYLDNNEGATTDINNPEDMLGKELQINGKPHIITGIIDTNFNSFRYDKLFTGQQDKLDYDILRGEYETALKHGIHGLVFLRSNYCSDILNGGFDKTFTDFYLKLKVSLISKENPSDGNRFTFESDKISVLKEAPGRIYWRNGIGKSKLGENEILLPISTIPLETPLGEGTFAELREEKKCALAYEFAREHFEEIREDFEWLYGPSNFENYYYIILTNPNNRYHPGYDRNYFEKMAEDEILNEYFFDEFIYVPLEGCYYSAFKYDYDVRIAGFYDYAKFRDNECDYPLIVSDELYERISAELRLFPYTRLLVHLKEKSDYRAVVDVAFFPNGYPINVINEVIYTFQSVDSLFRRVAAFALAVGGVLALFSSVLLYGYINIVISSRQRDIGILRALGASRQDIMKVFLFESVLIAAIPALLSGPGCLLISNYANDILINGYGMIISILHYGPAQFFLILVLSIPIAVLATIIPIWKYSRSKPIDVIKDI